MSDDYGAKAGEQLRQKLAQQLLDFKATFDEHNRTRTEPYPKPPDPTKPPPDSPPILSKDGDKVVIITGGHQITVEPYPPPAPSKIKI